MGTRPLRHFYTDDGVRLEVDADLGSVIEPWSRHRRRFRAELASLSDAQWTALSRCEAWTNREVICHLIDVDAFWTLTLESGRNGEPTQYLRDFDPAETPRSLVESRSSLSTTEVFEAFTTNGERLARTVESFTDDQWQMPCESPMGHVSARLTLAHGLWDSWLHERDVLLALGLDVPVEADELAAVTWYSLFLGGAQGGLPADPRPVAPGPAAPIDARVAFDEMPGDAFRVVVDEGVCVGPARDAPTAGSAVRFVEGLTGRLEPFPPPGTDLDPALAAHLARARAIL